MTRATRSDGIIFFSGQDYWYHNRAHSDFQLAKGLAKMRPVLLVNSIGMRVPTRSSTSRPWRRILRKAASTARAVRRPEPGLPDLVVMSPVIVPFYGSARARRLNAALVRAQVGAVARWVGIRRPALLVTIPTAVDVVRGMPRSAQVVNRSDKFSALPEADGALVAGMERQLLAESDAAVYVSHRLMAEEANATQGPSVFLGHGVDVDHFVALPPPQWPADVIDLEHPVIGFFGGLDDYVIDFALIRRLADALTTGTVLLVGDATCDISDLAAHPRVRWVGMRPYAEIPAYGSVFDVAIMPWLDNEWITYCNPIKAKEYLALGLPVVSTYYPEAELLGHVIDVTKDADEFIAAVLTAVETGGPATPAERRAAVAGDSWQARSELLLALVDEVSH